MKTTRNVFGDALEVCSLNPLTGIYGEGRCETDDQDLGTHVVCPQVTKEFLGFTKSRGDDLSAASPDLNVPGLNPGDRWCLCAGRWKEAHEPELAPPVDLSATHEKALEFVELEDFTEHALEE